MLFDRHVPQLGWLLCVFLTHVATLLSSSLLAVFGRLQSAIFGKQFFFFYSIYNINSHGVQTTDPFLINMLNMFLTWLIVVLLLLQTMQHRHRCFFTQSCPVWCKMRVAFYANWPTQKMILSSECKRALLSTIGGECPWHVRKRFPNFAQQRVNIEITLMINITWSRSR